jgi:hypothetical protein
MMFKNKYTMKKVILELSVCLFLFACGNKTQSSISSSDSIQEISLGDIAEVQNPEAEEDNYLIKISRHEQEFDKNAYEIEIRLLEDGSVKFQFITITPMDYPDEDKLRRDTINQNGSWKEISVKRGKNYLDAYEIGISSGNLYCTEKFDYLWGIADDLSFYHFNDGKTGFAWKITSVEKY